MCICAEDQVLSMGHKRKIYGRNSGKACKDPKLR
jgi:hypothetical protein